MKKANVHEAKTHLSKLVELVQQGQEVIICKAGKPVAKLIAYETKKRFRQPGAWAGKVKIKKDFDVLPHDLMTF